jgi:spermidine synthase
MVYEIAGSRVLGPYLGTSIFIWTSLIGIILGSLSLGYWLGGKLADRNPSYKHLAWIILASGVLILLTNLFKEVFLRNLPAIIPGLKWQSVLSAIILFAPASIFLGMVSPYAVKLKIKNLQTSGTTVGNLYAISTVGSIAGTFLAGFVLIPLIGTTNILYSLAIVQALLTLPLLFLKEKPGKLVIPLIFLLFSAYTTLAFNKSEKAFIDVDTPYSRVWIYDVHDAETGKEIRYMRINNESSSTMFLESDSLVFPYSHYYRLAELYTPGFSSTLLLGGAAYSYPKYFLNSYPSATMDVVEIDLELTRLARVHFRLADDPRLGIFHEDARTYINRTEKRYDVIYGDLFRSQYTLPWHLTTLEAAMGYYRVLNDGGCMLVNIISSIKGTGSKFLEAELQTFREVFPHVHVFAVYDPEDHYSMQSIILAAVKGDEKAASDFRQHFENFLENEITELIGPAPFLLTDEHAPVDYFMGRAIR